jgi:hypothetical protein
MQIPTQTLTVELEFVDADERIVDPATVGQVSSEVVNALRTGGYTVTPTYTSARGGDLFALVMQMAQTIQDNKEFLQTLFTLATPIATYLLKRQQTETEPSSKKPQRPEKQDKPVKVTIEIDGASLTIEAADTANALGLAERFQTLYPTVASRVSSNSKVKVVGHVPARQRRSRR